MVIVFGPDASGQGDALRRHVHRVGVLPRVFPAARASGLVRRAGRRARALRCRRRAAAPSFTSAIISRRSPRGLPAAVGAGARGARAGVGAREGRRHGGRSLRGAAASRVDARWWRESWRRRCWPCSRAARALDRRRPGAAPRVRAVDRVAGRSGGARAAREELVRRLRPAVVDAATSLMSTEATARRANRSEEWGAIALDPRSATATSSRGHDAGAVSGRSPAERRKVALGALHAALWAKLRTLAAVQGGSAGGAGRSPARHPPRGGRRRSARGGARIRGRAGDAADPHRPAAL